MQELELIEVMISIVVGLITIGGVIFALMKNLNLRSRIVDTIFPKIEADKRVNRHLTFWDIKHGTQALYEKLRKYNPDYIIAVHRGGAIIGGILAKYFYIEKIRHIYIDADKNMRCGFDVSELADKNVLLVDDCMRTGHSINQAHDLLKNKYKKMIEKGKMEKPPKVIQKVVFLFTRLEKNKEPEPIYAYHTSEVNIRLPWDINWGQEEKKKG